MACVAVRSAYTGNLDVVPFRTSTGPTFAQTGEGDRLGGFDTVRILPPFANIYPVRQTTLPAKRAWLDYT